MKAQVKGIFASFGLHHTGVCRFEDALPLLRCRAARRLPADPQSVIMCALPYYGGEFPRRNVARYAVWDDYHVTAGALLSDLCRKLAEQFPHKIFAPFVDISPIREVQAAALAGLGVVGRNRQLILSDYGSYLFLGSIVTDFPLEPDKPSTNGCLDCGACVAACPTRALSQEGIDQTRCRSFITQKKGELTPWEQAQITFGGMVWGCDVCQDICPMNKNPPPSPLTRICQNPVPVLTRERLGELMKTKPYGYRGRALLERNLSLLGG